MAVLPPSSFVRAPRFNYQGSGQFQANPSPVFPPALGANPLGSTTGGDAPSSGAGTVGPPSPVGPWPTIPTAAGPMPAGGAGGGLTTLQTQNGVPIRQTHTGGTVAPGTNPQSLNSHSQIPATGNALLDSMSSVRNQINDAVFGRVAGIRDDGMPLNANGWPMVQTPSGWMPMGGPGGGYNITQSENGVPIRQTHLNVPMGGNWEMDPSTWNSLFPGTSMYGG